MFESELVRLIAIAILAVSLRLPFILIHTTDNDVHIWKINEIKKSQKLLDFSHNVTNSMADGWYIYPCLNHCLIGLFPRRYWILVGKLLNIIYDLFALAAVYLISRYWLLNEYASNYIWGFSTAGLVALLYTTTPVFFPITARLKSIGTRVLGNLIGLLYFFSFGYAFIYNDFNVYILCGILVLLSALSSKFGFQTIVLFSLVLSFFYLSPVPIIVVLITVLIGCLIPGLGIKRLLIGHWDFYKLYWQNYNRGTTAQGRNNLRDVFLLPLYLFTNVRRFFNLCFKKITPIIAIVSAPIIGFWIYWFVTSPSKTWQLLVSTSELKYLSFLCGTSIVVFVLTSIKPLFILGQAERYFSYSIGYFYIITIHYILANNSHSSLIIWIFIMNLTGICLHYLYTKIPLILKINKKLSESNLWNLIKYLKNRKNLRIITLPTKESYKISVCLNDSGARYYYDHLTLKEGGRKYMIDEKPYIGVIREDLQHFKHKYNINTFIVRKDFMRITRDRGYIYNLEKENKVFENEDYEVYEL